MLACPWPHACQGGHRSNITTPATTNGGRRLSSAQELTDAAAGCAPGYKGPLCAVCEKHYYFSSTTTTCEACGNNGAAQISVMIVVPILLLAALAAIVILFMNTGHKLVGGGRANLLAAMFVGGGEAGLSGLGNEEEEGGHGEAGGASAEVAGGGGVSTTGSPVLLGATSDAAGAMAAPGTEGNEAETQNAGNQSVRDSGNNGGSSSSSSSSVYKGCQKALGKMLRPFVAIVSAVSTLCYNVMGFLGNLNQDLLMPIMKIMMTACQIVSGIPKALNLKFPPFVTRLFSILDFVNFTSMNFGSPQCYYKYDFVDVLMLQTVAPMICIIVLFLAYLLDHMCRTTPMERTIYVTGFFLITYMVLPRYGLM